MTELKNIIFLKLDKSIVDARPSIFENVCKLYRDAFNGPPWNEKWSFERAKIRILDLVKYERSLGIVACNPASQTPLAIAIGVFQTCADYDQFYINELCVHPDWQKQGLGQLTLNKIIETAFEQGAQKIYLYTEKNSHLEKFYAKRGFQADSAEIQMSMQKE